MKKIISTDIYLTPQIIPDNTEQLVENFREEKIRMTSEWNTERRHVEMIEALKDSNTDIKIKNKVKFDEAKNTFSIGNVSIKTRGFRLQLLTLLFKDGKKWDLDKLFDQLEGEASESLDEYPKFSTKLYSTCYGINEQVAIKTKINDFLLFSKSYARINPEYL